jgi:hypothetical protein
MRRTTDLSRREFSAALAAVTLAACARRAPTALPAPVGAPPAPNPAPPAAPITTSAAPAAAATPADPNAPLADALFTVVTARFGTHITEEQRPSVRADILNAIRTAQRVRTTPLTNADDPFPVCVGPAAPVSRPRRRCA